MDAYRVLLKKYMRMIIMEEGTAQLHKIDRWGRSLDPQATFSIDERRLLRDVLTEIRAENGVRPGEENP